MSASRHAIQFQATHALLRHRLPPRDAAVAEAAQRTRYDNRWKTTESSSDNDAERDTPHNTLKNEIFDVFDGRKWSTVRVKKVNDRHATVEPVNGRKTTMRIPLREFDDGARVVPATMRTSASIPQEVTARRDERMRLAERMLANQTTAVDIQRSTGLSTSAVSRNKYVTALAVRPEGTVAAKVLVGPAFPKQATKTDVLKALTKLAELTDKQPRQPPDIEMWMQELQGNRSLKNMLYDFNAPPSITPNDGDPPTPFQVIFVPPFTSAPIRRQLVLRAAQSPAAKRADFLREVTDTRSPLHKLFLQIHKHNPGVTAHQLLSARGLSGAAVAPGTMRVAHRDEEGDRDTRVVDQHALRWPAECRRWIRSIQNSHMDWGIVDEDGVVSFERWKGATLRPADISAARRAVGLSRKRMAVAPAESTKLHKMLEYEAFLNIQKRLNAENLVFFDEVSIEMLGNSPMGWSLGGKRAVSRRPASLGLKTHVIAAIAWPDLSRKHTPFWFLRIYPPMGNNVETFKEWTGSGTTRRPVYRLKRYQNLPPPKEEFRTQGCTARIFAILKEHNERFLDAPDSEVAGAEDILRYEGTRDSIRSRRLEAASAHSESDEDTSDMSSDDEVDVEITADPTALFRYAPLVQAVMQTALATLAQWRDAVLNASRLWLKNVVANQQAGLDAVYEERRQPAMLAWIQGMSGNRALTTADVLSAGWSGDHIRVVHPMLVDQVVDNHIRTKQASARNKTRRGGAYQWRPEEATVLHPVLGITRMDTEYAKLKKKLLTVKARIKLPDNNAEITAPQLRERVEAMLKLAGVFPDPNRLRVTAGTDTVPPYDWAEAEDPAVGSVIRPDVDKAGEGVVQAYSIDSMAMYDFFMYRITDDLFFRLDKATNTFHWRSFVCDGAAWHGRQRAPLSTVPEGSTGNVRTILSQALEPHEFLKRVRRLIMTRTEQRNDTAVATWKPDVPPESVPRRRRADARSAFEKRSEAATSACKADWFPRLTAEHHQAAQEVLHDMKAAARARYGAAGRIVATRAAMLLAAQEYLTVGSARQQFRTVSFDVRDGRLEHRHKMKTSPLYHAITARRAALRKRFQWAANDGRMLVEGTLYDVAGEPEVGTEAHTALLDVYTALVSRQSYRKWKPAFDTAMTWFAHKTSYTALHPGRNVSNVSVIKNNANPTVLRMQSVLDFESHLAAGPDVLVFTPAYQPMFNPIERVFSVMKAALRREDIGGLHKNGAMIVADRMDDPFMNDDQTGSRLRRDVSRGIHKAFRQVSPATVMNNILCSGYMLPGDSATPQSVRRRVGLDCDWQQVSMLSRSAKERLQYEWYMLQHDCRIGADVRKTGPIHRRILTFDGNRCLRRGTRWFGFDAIETPDGEAAADQPRSVRLATKPKGPLVHPLSAEWQRYPQPQRFPRSYPVATTRRAAPATAGPADSE